MLFLRSLSEFILILLVYSGSQTRQSILVGRDISYGLLTSLYLILVARFAFSVANPSDKGGRDARTVHSNVRQHILEKLDERTNSGRFQSPAFRVVLDEVRTSIDNPAVSGPLWAGSNMGPDQNRRAVLDCLELSRIQPGKCIA